MLSLCPPGTDHLVVLDLEWNQNAYAPNLAMPHEIIEIGAVRLRADYSVDDTLSLIVAPRAYRTLDKHIREVTGITQEELQNGMPFSAAFARLLSFAGEHACLCTWGRDDYPVLLRNIKFFQMNLPFAPPLNAQTVFAHLIAGNAGKQVGLHMATEMLGLTPELPAHRAVNDALVTASLLHRLQAAWDDAASEAQEGLRRALAQESLIAASDVRSCMTRYQYQTDAIKDAALCTVRCPVCGGATQSVIPFFDTGHERYVSLCACPSHDMALAQMHFKRAPSGKLIMHQRVFPADEQIRRDTRRQHEEYLKNPPRPRIPRRRSTPTTNG